MLKSSDRFSSVLSTEEIEQLLNILQPVGNGAFESYQESAFSAEVFTNTGCYPQVKVDHVESFQSSWRTRRIHNKIGFSFTTNGDDKQTPLQYSMYLEEDNCYDIIAGFVAQGFDTQVAYNVIKCISLTYDVLALILDTSATFSAE